MRSPAHCQPALTSSALVGSTWSTSTRSGSPSASSASTLSGDVCVPLRPFLVGDTVFTDLNGNGSQDAGDNGIGGVVVNLLTDFGGFVASTTTLADGSYRFEVDAGGYSVEIDPSNFTPGGVLAGRSSTTGGETLADTVVDDNVLTYDFGYTAPANGSIGDFVWFDDNQNGVQDEPVGSGLNNVTVTLFDSGGGIVATATTNSNGAYLFEMLEPGNYTVQVNEATLPGTFFSTTVNNPLVVNLGADESFVDADFGYALDSFEPNLLGDFVWEDLNGGRCPRQWRAGDRWRGRSFSKATSTAMDCPMCSATPSPNSAAATSSSSCPRVPTRSVSTPTHFPPASRFRPLISMAWPRPTRQTGFLGGSDFRGGLRLRLPRRESGYRGHSANRIWLDDNGNGIQDPGEDGINGVIVTLRDSGGKRGGHAHDLRRWRTTPSPTCQPTPTRSRSTPAPCPQA